MGSARSRRVDLGGKKRQLELEPDEREAQRRSIQQQLRAAQERAAAALGVVGPSEATAIHAVGRWPSGAPIDLYVLCLGEEHLPASTRPGFLTIRQLMQVAAERARSLGVCVDAFLEESMQRCDFVSVGGNCVPSRADRSRPRGVMHVRTGGLAQITWSLAGAVPPPHHVETLQAQRLLNPLGETGARVHWFDSRGECGDISSEHKRAMGRAYDGEVIRIDDAATRRRWMLALMGMKPDATPLDRAALPRDFLLQLEQVVGGAAANAWERGHWANFESRVYKRAQRMHAVDLTHLAETIVDTHRETNFAAILANVADFYLMLRMLVPYRAGPVCAAGPPRHCLVYAGAFHTRHVIDILGALGHSPDENAGFGASRPRVRRFDPVSPETRREKNYIEAPIESLLSCMGLAHAAGDDDDADDEDL